MRRTVSVWRQSAKTSLRLRKVLRAFAGLLANALPIEHVAADPRGSHPLSPPRRLDSGAVVEQRAAGRVRRRVDQQPGGYKEGRSPAPDVPRPVAPAIAPPRELTRRLFAALIYDTTGGRRKMPAAHAIEYCPAHRDHAQPTLSPGLPVNRKREAVLLLPQRPSVDLVRADRSDNARQYNRYCSSKHSRGSVRGKKDVQTAHSSNTGICDPSLILLQKLSCAGHERSLKGTKHSETSALLKYLCHAGLRVM